MIWFEYKVYQVSGFQILHRGFDYIIARSEAFLADFYAACLRTFNFPAVNHNILITAAAGKLRLYPGDKPLPYIFGKLIGYFNSVFIKFKASDNSVGIICTAQVKLKNGFVRA